MHGLRQPKTVDDNVRQNNVFRLSWVAAVHVEKVILQTFT